MINFPSELIQEIMKKIYTLFDLSLVELRELKSVNTQLPETILEEHKKLQQNLAVKSKEKGPLQNSPQEQEPQKVLHKTSQQQPHKIEKVKTVKKKNVISKYRDAIFSRENKKKHVKTQTKNINEASPQENSDLFDETISTTLPQSKPLDENKKSKRKAKGKELDKDYSTESDDEHESDSYSHKSMGGKF